MGVKYSYGVIAIYPTPQSMADKVAEYFDHCFVMKYNARLGVDVPMEVETPTFSGLARYLGFESRSALKNYKNERDEAYEKVINDAKLRIESYLESKLIHSKNPNGVIFALKNNADWEDTKKQQISGDEKQPLMFTWAADAEDVIDASTVKEPEKVGGGVPPGRLLESTVISDE